MVFQGVAGCGSVPSDRSTLGRSRSGLGIGRGVFRKSADIMKSDETQSSGGPKGPGGLSAKGKARTSLSGNIAESIDSLVEYLVDNGVKGIHPLIMGEVEKRLIIKVLEHSRGNKLRAAELLGISRNTFHRKIRRISDLDSFLKENREL